MDAIIYTRQPHKHQLEALRQAKDKQSFAYFMEMGTGKSKVFVDEVIQFHLINRINLVMIFAGKGSYRDWIDKHLPENMPANIPYRAHLWQGCTTVGERNRLTQFMNSPETLRFLIMNTEAVAVSMNANTVAYNFTTKSRCILCVDESTMVKNYKADRTMAIAALARRCTIKRIMTGSAITQSPMDLWGQFMVLGLERFLAPNWFSFRSKYCSMIDINVPLPGGNGRRTLKKIVGYKNLDILEQVIKQHSFRVMKSECLDLPPKIYEKVEVELTKEQKRHYTEMVKLALTEIEQGLWASASTVLVKLTRLHQIVCGHIRDEDGTLHTIKTNRLIALDNVISEMSGKVLIWAAHRADVSQVIDHLREEYPSDKTVRYDGLVNPPDRATALKAFQEGDARFFVGTAATGGFGITLTACSNVIYYSNSFNLEQRIQSEDRCHRIGQHNPVVYVDLVAEGTVEEKIIQALRDKKTIADIIMGDGVKKWLNW